MKVQYLLRTQLLGNILLVLGESCKTYDGSDGNCAPIFSCPSLLKTLHKANRTADDVDVLRKSTCGFEGSTPKVCCPNLCMTPEGEQGTCVQRQSCKHLCKACEAKSCPGSDNSICCGPRPNEPRDHEDCGTIVTAYPSSSCCGYEEIGSYLIKGSGGEAQLGEFPWLALIEYESQNGTVPLCGGALISGKYVLTAAHCTTGDILEEGQPISIRLAEHDTSSELDCVPVQHLEDNDCANDTISIPIEHIIVHPQYDPIGRRNDIALIRLQTLAPYTDLIRPICLPTSDYTLSPPPVFRLFAAGWGAVNTTHLNSSKKLYVDLPFVELDVCQKAYSSLNLNVTLWDGQLCAGGEKGKDSCKGDSGGPLMFQSRRRYEAVGLISFGPSPCGLENFPAIYTKVYAYNDWIYSNIKP